MRKLRTQIEITSMAKHLRRGFALVLDDGTPAPIVKRERLMGGYVEIVFYDPNEQEHATIFVNKHDYFTVIVGHGVPQEVDIHE